jgi:hypothetical protein
MSLRSCGLHLLLNEIRAATRAVADFSKIQD